MVEPILILEDKKGKIARVVLTEASKLRALLPISVIQAALAIYDLEEGIWLKNKTTLSQGSLESYLEYHGIKSHADLPLAVPVGTPIYAFENKETGFYCGDKVLAANVTQLKSLIAEMKSALINAQIVMVYNHWDCNSEMSNAMKRGAHRRVSEALRKAETL